MDEIKLSKNQLEAISRTLGDSLTGSEIDGIIRSLGECMIGSIENTKWRRINQLFGEFNICNETSKILEFLKESLEKISFVQPIDKFEETVSGINKILIRSGVYYSNDGKFVRDEPMTSIEAIDRRFSTFVSKAKRLGIHEDIIRYCEENLNHRDYYGVITEAVKSLLENIREKAGTKEDGNKLVDIAFSTKDPRLALNDLSNQNEINQQKGFVEMLKGIIYFYRNVNAHSAKIQTNYSETDVLEALVIISFLQRRLEECTIKKTSEGDNTTAQ